MKEEISTEDFIIILSSICETIEDQKDYLSELDREIGDGDHGVTMSIGWWQLKKNSLQLIQVMVFIRFVHK